MKERSGKRPAAEDPILIELQKRLQGGSEGKSNGDISESETNRKAVLGGDMSGSETNRGSVTIGGTIAEAVIVGDATSEAVSEGATPGANTSRGGILSAHMLAVSRAGHDKDTVYVVLAEDGPYLYLADGRRRTLAKPKKKKRMHVQLITHLSADILDAMQELHCDAHLRKVIRAYELRVAHTDERCGAGAGELREAENGNLSKEESKIRRTVD